MKPIRWWIVFLCLSLLLNGWFLTRAALDKKNSIADNMLTIYNAMNNMTISRLYGEDASTYDWVIFDRALKDIQYSIYEIQSYYPSFDPVHKADIRSEERYSGEERGFTPYGIFTRINDIGLAKPWDDGGKEYYEQVYEQANIAYEKMKSTVTPYDPDKKNNLLIPSLTVNELEDVLADLIFSIQMQPR
jgi:hypothetical protein